MPNFPPFPLKTVPAIFLIVYFVPYVVDVN